MDCCAWAIGDTIRVTLTADPVEEIYAAKKILRAAGLRKEGVNLIACPTCGRTRIDLIPMAEEVERRLANCKKNITVAVRAAPSTGPEKLPPRMLASPAARARA